MAKLCKAGQQLREQIDDAFPSRDRASDGWKASAGHKAHSPKSDHNPMGPEQVVRAIDVDSDLQSDKSAAFDLANQLRLLARTDKRISYIIFNERIASWVGNYKWRKYKGINPHKKHIHISFTKLGDNDGSMFYLPILTGEENEPSKSNSRKLGKKLFSSGNSDVSSGGLGCSCDCQCCSSRESSSHPAVSKS
ncbi:MAG: hypothetical protein EBR30_17175 [Cytophagia bacterium]|nr:hypothetical protein [Cytophagia bacterium]NBW36716.1 hypothetical protein [Cytophagia bacterium]